MLMNKHLTLPYSHMASQRPNRSLIKFNQGGETSIPGFMSENNRRAVHTFIYQYTVGHKVGIITFTLIYGMILTMICS